MPNGNGNGNGNGGASDFWRDMPWWVKAVAIVGVPSLISIGVVMSDRMQIVGTLEKNKESVLRIESLTTLHDSRMWLRFDELTAATKETNRILLAGCVNEANRAPSTEAAATARDRCFGR